MGRAVAPMRKRWPDTSRHGPRRGLRARRSKSSTSWPTICTICRAWSSPCSTSTPRRSTSSNRRQGGGAGGLVMVSSATRSSRVRCTSVNSRRAGQAWPQWFHSSWAPTWSSHCRLRKSHPKVAAGALSCSWRRSSFHCARVPSSAAPQRPCGCAHGPSGVSVRTMRGATLSMVMVRAARAAGRAMRVNDRVKHGSGSACSAWHILPGSRCNFYQNTLQRLLNKRNQLFI